jgi:bisphosphoglycerate-dependent phosphoglycerate mutase
LTVPWLPRPFPEEEQDSLESLSTAAHSVVMMRHGESLFNKHNVFTGWCDVPLTENGRKEATHAGRILASHGLEFDVVFCSVLQRSAITAQLALEACGQSWVDVRPRWELNERHYGALQGLSKDETVEKEGLEAVREWRSAYHSRPPPMTDDHPHWPMIASDRRYAPLLNGGGISSSSSFSSSSSSSSSSSPSFSSEGDLHQSGSVMSLESIWRHGSSSKGSSEGSSEGEPQPQLLQQQQQQQQRPPNQRHTELAGRLPRTESIADTAVRVMELWTREVVPLVASGKRVLVVAHRNSLRALLRNLEGLNDDQVRPSVRPSVCRFVRRGKNKKWDWYSLKRRRVSSLASLFFSSQNRFPFIFIFNLRWRR